MNVVLIGFSGTGKSTVARLLAELLGWKMVDTDRRVEQATGYPIHRIFSEQGVDAFRRLERIAVRDALSGDSQVISVGGGAVLDPDSRREMRDGNLVVLLDAPVDILYRRLAAHVSAEPRPLLEGDDPLERMRSLKAERESIYAEAAHLIVDTGSIDEHAVAWRIAAALRDRDRPGADVASDGSLEGDLEER